MTTIPPARLRVSVGDNREVAREIHLIHFDLPPDRRVPFEAGQYVTFFLQRDGHQLTKSYSFASSASTADGFDLLVKRVRGGFASNLLCDAVRDTSLTALMPLGKFTLRDPGARSVLFLATGTGLAPFVPMLDELHRTHPNTKVNLIVGSRYEGDLIFPERLRALEQSWPSFRYFPTLSHPPTGWTGTTGHIQDVVRTLFRDLRDRDVYICGVPEMVGSAQALAEELGTPKERIFVERY